MSYRIASFNMRNISLKTDRNLNRIAKIILGEDNPDDSRAFDIVAMQEVLSEGRVVTGIRANNKSALEKSLIGRLGKHWDAYWESPRTHAKNDINLGEDVRGEGYLFLWNTRKFELLRDKNNCIIYPSIFQHYKTMEGMPRLIRDPLYGRFRIKNTNIELRLITTHIVSGKPSNSLNTDLGAVALRRHEFNVIAGSIYSRISDYRKDVNCTNSYTIILGDYNLNLTNSDAGNPKFDFPGEVACCDSNGCRVAVGAPDSRCIITKQIKRTSLGEGHYANNFDHFSFDKRVNDIVMGCSRIDAVHSQENPEDQTEEQKFARFYKEVSDHVPIVIDINFRKF